MKSSSTTTHSAKAQPTSKPAPTAARIRELLDYDPDTGILTWRISRGRSKAGSVAGSLDTEGNRQIRIDGRLYMAKQVVRAHVTGIWPGKDWHNRKRSAQYKK